MRRILTILPFVIDETVRASHERMLRRSCGRNTHVEVVGLDNGPTTADFDKPGFKHAVAGIVDLVKRRQSEFNGLLISCFEDPGLSEARNVATVPVAAPCETAMLIMRLTAEPFFVVSPDRGSEAHLRGIARTLGVESQFRKFEWVEFDVGGPAVDVPDLVNRTVTAIHSARKRRGGDVAILGCTDFIDRYDAILARAGGRVIEPASESIRLLEWIIEQKHSSARASRTSNLP